MSAATIPRRDWERRYAARVMQAIGCDPTAAAEIAKQAAEQHERDSLYHHESVAWSADPEGEADRHIAHWTDDEQ